MKITVNEAALNRITARDAAKKVTSLQKQGKLDAALHEVTAVTKYVQNALANSVPEIKDNALNAQEKKIVTRAILEQVVSNFGYRLAD